MLKPMQNDLAQINATNGALYLLSVTKTSKKATKTIFLKAMVFLELKKRTFWD